MRLAVYPGSFDPPTKGHLDIVQRASRLFDRVVVAVLSNPSKRSACSVGERIRLLKECLRGVDRVEVDTFSGLLVDYLRKRGAHIIIRGVRAVSDMEYEFQMASMNRHLYSEAETVFLMPDERYTYLSSSIVKEVSRMGARVDEHVPPPVSRWLRRKLAPRRRAPFRFPRRRSP